MGACMGSHHYTESFQRARRYPVGFGSERSSQYPRAIRWLERIGCVVLCGGEWRCSTVSDLVRVDDGAGDAATVADRVPICACPFADRSQIDAALPSGVTSGASGTRRTDRAGCGDVGSERLVQLDCVIRGEVDLV